jgi:sugar O-acyltransferase (sialic acid O-acetyltransferase NeuD family)
VIIGAGGFAREVKWLIQDINEAADRGEGYEFTGYVVSDLSKLTDRDSKEEVVGDFSWLEQHREEVDALTLGIGTPAPRLRVAEQLEPLFPADRWPALIHPSVRFDPGSCEVGHGVILCAGVIGTVNIEFKPYSMVNLSCTIGHEAVIGSGAVLNPTVNISGGVEIGRGVLVGTGAQVLQYVSVGDHATVGGGAVVSKPVAESTTVVGIPAKPLAPRK